MAGTRSGYQRTISLCPDELHFVDPPPKQMALGCPICFSLLFNPHIVSCCGNHFCEHCLERVKDEDSPCPMCKEESYTSIRNKALQRDINQLEVYCPNSSTESVDSSGDYHCREQVNVKGGDGVGDGQCEWRGEIGLLEVHLNADHRMGDCQFVIVGCTHGCGHSDQRNRLSEHELRCSQRPFSCDYCGEYESTCEDVVDRHWKECKMYPIECPNVCELRYLARGRLEEHLKDECELEVVSCKFSWAGCGTRVQRSILEEHVRDNVVGHMQMLSLSCLNVMEQVQRLEKDNEALKTRVTQLEEDNCRARGEIQTLQTENTNLGEVVSNLQYENDTLKHQVTKMFTESRAEQEVLARRSFSLESSIGLPPFLFIMDNLEEKLQMNTVFFSPPFYSHIGGYRLRVKVTPNGIFFGEGTHISLTVYLMKGVFDDYLRWPFRGSVTVSLLDQHNDTEHKVDTVTFDKGTSSKASGRVMKNDMNEKGLVMYEFFDHAWLKPTSKKKRIYVKDDKLLFKVVNVSTNDISNNSV